MISVLDFKTSLEAEKSLNSTSVGDEIVLRPTMSGRTKNLLKLKACANFKQFSKHWA
jgi:hypothetical protein